jgi:NAD(P)H-hydrate epimerase
MCEAVHSSGSSADQLPAMTNDTNRGRCGSADFRVALGLSAIVWSMATSFMTDDGLGVPAVTASQMREIDRVAIEETGPNLFQMMENAGRSLARQALHMLGAGWKNARIVVLAGSGGNGGGGICAARHVANRDIDVALVLAEPDRLNDVPAFQRKVFDATPGRVVDRRAVHHERADLIVDALIGYGLHSAPSGSAAELIAWANESGASILALDLPSGLNATTGECPGVCIRAHTTLTLALPKTGLGSNALGELWLADIGIPRATFERAGVKYTNPFGEHYRIRLTRPAA